ncbi:MAG TPA: response regulator [Ktedonosporobacter sp.]|nr:response regulator [Ktedonosporobacter sp.]
MRLLIIDDNPADRELIKRAIGKIFEAVSYVEVIHQRGFEEALEPLDYQIVFTDYHLKWSTGIEVLKAIRARSSVLPVIMVTDTGNEEIAALAMKQGLNDYVLKTHLYRLPLAIKECLERVQLQRERQDLQVQIQKAQKMESLGLLVSGIAHDFNNLLAVIAGFAELGIRGTPQEASPFHEYFEHIHRRAQQGARMTGQLLAFARGTPMEPKYLNMNEQITALLDFLRALLGTSIDLDFEADPALKAAYADATQWEQVLVNLCLNARDAMPMGGNLKLVTRQIEMAQGSQHVQPYLLPGSYVLVQVRDTGIGMDEQVQARLFEPFFTTKEVGQGTGLGLAVVYGIIKQHHGTIRVQSQPGQGTTFSLYLPAVEHRLERIEEEVSHKRMAMVGDRETILLVEDDLDIQLMMTMILRDAGYTVIVAMDGEEGIALFEMYASSITLVIADIMMPKMKGRQFQEHVRRLRAGIKVLVVSGYQEIDLQQRDLLEAKSAFLQKPFDLDVLVAKVRELLTPGSSSSQRLP